jgi:hypothetical protein
MMFEFENSPLCVRDLSIAHKNVTIHNIIEFSMVFMVGKHIIFQGALGY